MPERLALVKWSYAASVERMRPLVARWKAVTVEMLGELYQAREELAKEGRPKTVSNETVRTWSDYLDDIGLSRATVHRWLAQYDPETGSIKEIEAPVAPHPAAPSPSARKSAESADEAEERPKEAAPPVAHVANNSGEIEWYTPEEYVEAARGMLGAIDLDPASCAEANTVVKATAFYTKGDDALTKEWAGRVFMNPPYSGGLMLPFCAKLLVEHTAGRVPEAIVLTNNATETQWFQALLRAAASICFPSGRIRFWRSGADSFTPLQGQALFYFGTRAKEFRRAFEGFGVTWRRRLGAMGADR